MAYNTAKNWKSNSNLMNQYEQKPRRSIGVCYRRRKKSFESRKEMPKSYCSSNSAT